MDVKKIVPDLCKYKDEQEWFEFKVNWFEPRTLGEYVSALSNLTFLKENGYIERIGAKKNGYWKVLD